MNFQPTPALVNAPQQAVALAELGRQQRVRNQVMQLNQSPGMTEGGLYTDQGIMALSQIDPALRDEAVQQRAVVLEKQSQERWRKAQEDKIRDVERQDAIDDFMAEAVNQYHTVQGSEEARKRAMSTRINEGVDAMIKDGRAAKYGLTSEQIQKLRSWNSPDDIMLALLKHGKLNQAEYLQAKAGARALETATATPETAAGAPAPIGGENGGPEIKKDRPASEEGTPLSDKPTYEEVMAGYQQEEDEAYKDLADEKINTSQFEGRMSEINDKRMILKKPELPEVKTPDADIKKAAPEDLIAKAKDAEQKAEKLRATGMPANIKQAKAYDVQAKKYRDQAQRATSLEQKEEGLELSKKRFELSEKRLSQLMAGADYEPGEVNNMAMDLLMFGKEPRGFGPAGNKIRADVHNRRAQIGEQLGLTPEEMAMLPQDNRIKMKAADKMTTWGAFVDKSSEQLNKSLDLAVKYAEQIGPTKMRALNKMILAGKKEFNDPIANAYAVQINTVRTEYSRLMSGPTSNAMLPVEAMKKGDDLISAAMDVPTLQEVGRAIRNDAKITRTAIDNQLGHLRSGMSGKKETYEEKNADLEPIGGRPPVKVRPNVSRETWTPADQKRLEELERKRGAQ